MPVQQLQFPEFPSASAANDCHSPASADAKAPVALVAQVGGEGGAGNEKRKGRRPVHASAAARKAAYRADKARIDFTDNMAIASTIAAIAAELDCSKNELMQSFVRFALTNRNWKQVGLYGARRDGALQ